MVKHLCFFSYNDPPWDHPGEPKREGIKKW
jgi:hypothetical protein